MDIKDTDVPGTVEFSVGAPVDAKGNAAQVDGKPSWSLDDESNCQIVSQSDDGLSCKVHVGDKPSAAQLRVRADADLGDGVTEIEEQVVINVVAGDAVGFGGGGISAGSVVPD